MRLARLLCERPPKSGRSSVVCDQNKRNELRAFSRLTHAHTNIMFATRNYLYRGHWRWSPLARDVVFMLCSHSHAMRRRTRGIVFSSKRPEHKHRHTANKRGTRERERERNCALARINYRAARISGVVGFLRLRAPRTKNTQSTSISRCLNDSAFARERRARRARPPLDRADGWSEEAAHQFVASRMASADPKSRPKSHNKRFLHQTTTSARAGEKIIASNSLSNSFVAHADRAPGRK